MRRIRTAGHGKRMAYLRAKLLEKRKALLAHLDRDLTVSVRSLDRVRGDTPDQASDSLERENAGFLAQMDAAQVGQIDAALTKISEGTYGLCEDCGKPIPDRRLRVLPFASLCTKCKEQEERHTGFLPEQPFRWSAVAGTEMDPEHITVRGRRLS